MIDNYTAVEGSLSVEYERCLDLHKLVETPGIPFSVIV